MSLVTFDPSSWPIQFDASRTQSTCTIACRNSSDSYNASISLPALGNCHSAVQIELAQSEAPVKVSRTPVFLRMCNDYSCRLIRVRFFLKIESPCVHGGSNRRCVTSPW